LTVAFILFLDLHLAHQVILVGNFIFDFLKVLGGFAKVLLFKVVFILVGWQLGCSENVLYCVRNYEIFVGYEAVDWLFIFLRNWGFLEAVFVLLRFH